MAIDVKIPPMGESITSGVLAKWHVADGTIVKKDQPLFELETDKITSEGTAETAGKLTIKVAAGTDVKIGEVVATIDETATSPVAGAAGPGPGSPGPVTAEAVASPAVRRLAAETGIDPASVTGTGKGGRVTKGDMLAASVSKPPFAAPATPAPVAGAAGPGPGSPSPALAADKRQTRTKMS
ncbi:MAG: hypothetical protein QG602_4147 [Verrucomicrobiota bacterium]|nr:hypothetical protein [Verrucomicrobiota bacterium]